MNKKIYNIQSVTTIERSNIVDITEQDIEDFANCELAPYVGNNDEELLEYLVEIFDRISSNDFNSTEDDLPEKILELYHELASGEVTRTVVRCSLSKSAESEIVIEDENGNDLAGITYIM